MRFEVFKITVFEPNLAKSLQKTRNDINLQISGVVQLQGDYNLRTKIWGKGPLAGYRGPPKEVVIVEF